MSLMDKLRGSVGTFSRSLTGDTQYLDGAAGIVAMVTYADGSAEDDEVDASLKALINNPVVSKSFDHNKIQTAFDRALEQAKTRTGRQMIVRTLQALSSRDTQVKESILLMGADVGDVDKKQGSASHGIGPDEHKVLTQAAAALGLDLKTYGIEQAA